MAWSAARRNHWPALDERHPVLAGVLPHVVEGLGISAAVRLRAGHVLGDTAAWHFLTQGTLSVVSSATSVNGCRLEVLTAPAVLAPEPRRDTSTIVALEPALCCAVSQAAMAEAMTSSPSLARNLVHDCELRLQAARARIELTTLPSITERVLHVLLAYAAAFGLMVPSGVRIRVPLTQEDIARDIGAARRSVGRVIRRLRDEGLIAREHGFVVLREPSLLSMRLGEPPLALVHSSASKT